MPTHQITHPLVGQHATLTLLPKPNRVEDGCGEAPPTAVIPAGSMQHVLTPHREGYGRGRGRGTGGAREGHRGGTGRGRGRGTGGAQEGHRRGRGGAQGGQSYTIQMHRQTDVESVGGGPTCTLADGSGVRAECNTTRGSRGIALCVRTKQRMLWPSLLLMSFQCRTGWTTSAVLI